MTSKRDRYALKARERSQRNTEARKTTTAQQRRTARRKAAR